MYRILYFFSLLVIIVKCNLLYSQSFIENQILNKSNEMELMPVTIHGGGVNAGTYYVAPAFRVFDIIKLSSANGIPDLRLIDCRSVKVRYKESILTIDLLKYLGAGDPSQNPFVQSGMDIQLEYAVNFAKVQGEIQGYILGEVPIRNGETIGDLLSLYTFSSLADSTNIIVSRENGEMKHCTLKEISLIKVNNKDFISVLPKKNVLVHAMVTVIGEAARPGIYPIVHSKTTISEILNQVGGASLKGNLKNAYLLRKKKIQSQPANSLLAGQDNIRPEVTGGFKYLAASRDYAVIPASETGTLLEDGDEIVIPAIEMCTYISGCVKMPGAYTFSEQKGISYYVTLAGGFTRSADKSNIKVITPFANEAYSISERNHIAPGDIIMVPEAEENKWVKKWSPIISVTASVISSASIIVGLINIAGR
jgi:protein involved in polysaccharide export with SLBB domain